MSEESPLQALVGRIDVSCLKPETDEALIRRTCREALKFGYAAVFAMPGWTRLVSSLLEGSQVKAGAPIGFPLGSHTTLAKVFEARDAIANGAQELDMQMNVGALKSGDADRVREDIRAVVEAAQGRLVKVILETCLLSEAEKRTACEIAAEAGADFVKTSSGFAAGGATVEDVRLLHAAAAGRMQVKAAGGIHTLPQALALQEAGATRFGIGAEKACRIVQEALEGGRNG